MSLSESRATHGSNAVLLLTLLVQFRKNSSTNPYLVKLSILDKELALHGYGQVITNSLVGYTQAYEASFAGSDIDFIITTVSKIKARLISLTSKANIAQLKVTKAQSFLLHMFQNRYIFSK